MGDFVHDRVKIIIVVIAEVAQSTKSRRGEIKINKSECTFKYANQR
jgi:hypothetical protein